jgi:hypothetical protein
VPPPRRAARGARRTGRRPRAAPPGRRCRRTARAAGRAPRPRPRPRPAPARSRPPGGRRAPPPAGSELDGNDAAGVLEDLGRATGRGRAHGDVVLLVLAGGDRVHGRGPAERLVLADEGGGGRLREHHAEVRAVPTGESRGQALAQVARRQPVQAALGQRADLGHGDLERVHGHADRLPMEHARAVGGVVRVVREALVRRAGVQQDERVVGGRVELDRDLLRRERDRVAHGPQHLRGAAERVGVLHLARDAVHEGTPREEAPEVRRGGARPRVGPHRVHRRMERPGRAAQRLDGHGRGDLGRADEAVGVDARQRRDGGRELGPVGDGQAVLGLQLEPGDPGLGHGLAGGHLLAPEARPRGVVPGREHEPEVRQRREVPGGATRSLRRHDRRDAGVEHGQDGVDEQRTAAGHALGQGIRAEQHHRPDDRHGQRRADPRGVAQHEVARQPRAILRGDGHPRQGAEARVHPVDGAFALPGLADPGIRPGHAGARVARERGRAGVAGDRGHVGQGEALTVDLQRSVTILRHRDGVTRGPARRIGRPRHTPPPTDIPSR